MQTFLPYSDFILSACCLDRKRLGKQRVETRQILETLLGLSDGWKNHPAVKMWRGYELKLAEYGIVICDQWISYGYKDNQKVIIQQLSQMTLFIGKVKIESPPWLGNEDFHRSHQSNLLRKKPDWYSQFGWNVSDNLPYVWNN